MTPCSFVHWLDDIFQPKRSGIIWSERRDLIWCQLPNLEAWENSQLFSNPLPPTKQTHMLSIIIGTLSPPPTPPPPPPPWSGTL